MCPDFQTLSAYFDGEVGSHWAGKIEAHVTACPSCQKQLAFFKKVRRFLLKADEVEYQIPMARVYQRLAVVKNKNTVTLSDFWQSVLKKRFSLPVPALITVLVVFIAAQIFSLSALYNQNMRIIKITKEPYGITEVQVKAPIEKIEAILQSIDRSGSEKEIFIDLPDKMRFKSPDKPVFIRSKKFSSLDQPR